MNIQIQVVNDKLTSTVRQRIRRRILKLTRFNDRLIRADAKLKKDNNNKLNGFHCEIRLMIKGNDLFARSKAVHYENAAIAVVESLRRQLMRLKIKTVKQRRKKKIIFRVQGL